MVMSKEPDPDGRVQTSAVQTAGIQVSPIEMEASKEPGPNSRIQMSCSACVQSTQSDEFWKLTGVGGFRGIEYSFMLTVKNTHTIQKTWEPKGNSSEFEN